MSGARVSGGRGGAGRDSRENLKNNAEEVIKRFTSDNARAEKLVEDTINPNLDLTKTKGENLKQMLKDGLISDSDFELMTRFKDLIGSTSKEELTLEELEQKAKERREVAIEDFEAAMDEIPSSLPNLSRDDAEALRFANGLKIKDLDIDRYDIDIGDRVKIVDGYEEVLETIIDCDSITGWTGASLDTSDYISGSASIYGDGYNPENSVIYYDFGEIMRFNNPSFFQFMIKAEDDTGDILEYSLTENSSDLFVSSNSIYVNTANVWQIVTCNN